MNSRPRVSVPRPPRERMRPPDPKPREGKHIFATKKTSIKKIFRSVDGIEETEENREQLRAERERLQEVALRIEDAEIRVNNIVLNTTQFLKLYLLHLYHTNRPFPTLDDEFLRVCMRIVSLETPNPNSNKWSDKNKERITQLLPFYNTHYLPLLGDDPNSKKVSMNKLKNILKYEETDMLKNIKNNIFMHYTDYCKELFNKKFDLKGRLNVVDTRNDLTEQEKKALKTQISTDFRIAKEDLLTPINTPLRCSQEFREWILFNRMILTKKFSFRKNNFEYELKADPLNYLYPMFYVCEQLNQYESFHHPIPLRSSTTPRYITLDSLGLMHLLVDEGNKKMEKNIKNLKPAIWNSYFKLDTKAFRRKDYLFHYMIKTDGVGASILFHRSDQNPDRLQSDPPHLSSDTKYVDDVRPNMNGFRVVGIDPGKEDLLHCTDGERFYRYTANQRRKQTKQKKYQYIRNEIKYYSQDYGYINDHSVTELERDLSAFNKFTCHFENFKNYIRAKINLLYQGREVYKMPFLRKLRWNSYINRQRSESKMITQIKRHFGTPDNIIIAIGDWSHKGHHMRGKEPTKGKGFRKIFKQAGYQTYLVHEFRTSKLCHDCNHELKPCRYRVSKKPRPPNILPRLAPVHGLRSCTTEHGCRRLWNRDVNGSLNIHMLAIEALNGRERPIAFRRDTSISGTPP